MITQSRPRSRRRLWGEQTALAVANFPFGDEALPARFIQSLALIKCAAARSNARLRLLPKRRAAAIASAASAVAAGKHLGQFPVSVFQTGSGTSSNMNANEVIAALAARSLKSAVHPNDDVNRGQSSNDVIPSAIHVAAMLALHERLYPALRACSVVLARRQSELKRVVKTGRTHLMDAMPLTLAQELSAWRAQIDQCGERLRSCEPRLLELALGGTAVGTGVNSHPRFAALACAELKVLTGLRFKPARNRFAALAAPDTALELSGQLRVLAASLMKIVNDLRWMNSGPNAGLAEIRLPKLQAGSSIMPGKVNPVIPEAVAMMCAQVIGHDVAVTLAGQSGNFQLNVMLPLIARNLLVSIELLTQGINALSARVLSRFEVNAARLAQGLGDNAILVTALNAELGYERGAAVVAEARRSGKPLREVVAAATGWSVAQVARRLDPLRLTKS